MGNFDILFIKTLRRLNFHENTSKARRLINLIDQIYDTKTGVVFLAETEPDSIFFDTSIPDSKEWSFEERELLDDLTVNTTKQAEDLAILSGENEAFSLKRMVSRMNEM